MRIEENLPHELVTTSTVASLAQHCSALLDQPPQTQVRGLVRLCQHLSQQYQQAPESCLERTWWQLFNQAGIQLRGALDRAKAEDYGGLSDQEVEQAYFLLIHVAYFFEPGGIAQSLWPRLAVESGDWQAKPPTSGAFGVVFASPPPVPAGARVREQLRRFFQRLGQGLGRVDPRDRGESAWLARAAQGSSPLEEGCRVTASPNQKEAP